MSKSLNKEEFIIKAQLKHGNPHKYKRDSINLVNKKLLANCMIRP